MEAEQIINYHKPKCLKCGSMVEKQEDNTLKCPDCGFEFANLSIKRMPKDIFLTFTAYAEKEFCNDYGMAFKSLVDEQLNSGKDQVIFGTLSDIEERLGKLEIASDSKKIRLVNGRVLDLKKRGEENGKV